MTESSIRISRRFSRAMLVWVLALSGHAFAADSADKHTVTALAGHVFEAPPSINSVGGSVAHIHLTQQDLYKEPAHPASGTQASTNAWGAAGAGAAPLVASGPATVYTTMAAAAAAGVEPFKKPDAAKDASDAHSRSTPGSHSGWKTYALLGAAILAVLGLTYIRKRKHESA